MSNRRALRLPLAGFSRQFAAMAAVVALCAADPAPKVPANDGAVRPAAQSVRSADPGAGDLSFSHNLLLNPVPYLPSSIVFVGKSGEPIASVRALLVLDGELLTVPLVFHEPSQAYRGAFPAPRHSLSYRFQVLHRSGRAELTASFSVEPGCALQGFVAAPKFSNEVNEALTLQDREQRLSFLLRELEALQEKDE